MSAQNKSIMSQFTDELNSRLHGVKSAPNLSRTKNDVDNKDLLFDLLAEKDGKLTMTNFWAGVRSTGILETDFRLKECRLAFETRRAKAGLADEPDEMFRVDKETFKECIAKNATFIMKIFKNDMVIPEFEDFVGMIHVIFSKCEKNDKGKPADHIPQLARMNKKFWGVGICTVDGQRKSFGNADVPFCMQSCVKPLNYALAVTELGTRRVHEFVGREPSGVSFDEIALDPSSKPHNPMINSGAIMTSSLIKAHDNTADRFDYVFQQYKQMSGGGYVGFSNTTYLAERDSADRNYALAYYMREKKCFPENADIKKILQFYLQCCSVESTAKAASVIAATLANGGVCPTTGHKLLSGEAVRNTLSLMHSCGMYDYSGQFAFKVGLPAKSGSGGAILVVVPSVMGICTFSPGLDNMNNSVRGVQFCQELVSIFNFHNYDSLQHTVRHIDPRRRAEEPHADAVVNLLFGAANGDVTAIRRFAALGIDMSSADYDGRTALHLACAEGHLSVVRLLLERGVSHKVKDRWGFTPCDDALKFGHKDVVEYIEEYEEKLRLGLKIIPDKDDLLSSGMMSPR